MCSLLLLQHGLVPGSTYIQGYGTMKSLLSLKEIVANNADTVFYPLVAQRIYSLKSSLLDGVEQLL